MKITEKQLRKIIQEEEFKLLKEGSVMEGFSEDEVNEFEEIMGQLHELLDQAFDISGEDEGARRYWYNTMKGCIDGQATMIPMSDTLEQMQDSVFDEEEF